MLDLKRMHDFRDIGRRISELEANLIAGNSLVTQLIR